MMQARHGTLVANAVTKVTLGTTFGDGETVEVLNRDGAAEIFCVIGDDAALTDPTIGGNDVYVLPASIGSIKIDSVRTPGLVTVRLVSAGTPKFSVAVG